MAELLPLFLNLTGRDVVLVGAGRVAAGKLRQLLAAGARVRIVAPDIGDEIAADLRDPQRGTLLVSRRPFLPEDLDGAWLVVAAAPPDVNRQVADAAESRRVFVNAVDDPPNASAYLSGVVRRDGVTVAISTSGDAPALTALLREGVDALLPRDLGVWLTQARAERAAWRRERLPMDERKPRLLRALNVLYGATAESAEHAEGGGAAVSARTAVASDANVPWLNAPEDSWL
ncbi:MAG: bifunctional precorrin-2 dehydrogenase/sirohydrochlorin ferrochelatase [Acidobacteria bacterium]|nr:bifunctional precorrin-2 dehydrogenase/sirohydrochlorin ferrochelatase [Acidobacteriota bacterium]